ncbi:MAG: S9 family peptidase [Candidatus Schekmanbacteria bacterium]|nr:S9 family peptidase [Candidatus Schekmanbacteria bacterium]
MRNDDYPVTPTDDVVDVYFGHPVRDPYRWLEGEDGCAGSASETLDQRVAAWTEAQNRYARKCLDAIPGREAVATRLAELYRTDLVELPVMRRNRLFFRRLEAGRNQNCLWVADGPAASPRLLLDPAGLEPGGLAALSWFAPCPLGSLVAVGLADRGDEHDTLYLIDAGTGRWRADAIPNSVQSVQWLADGTGFFYLSRSVRTDPYSYALRFHAVGTHYRHDPVFLEQYSTTWGPDSAISDDGRWLLVSYATGTDANDLWVVDLDEWRRTGAFFRREIAVGERATFAGPVHGDTLYLRTTLGAPMGMIYAVDLNAPQRDRWRPFLAARRDAAIGAVILARGLVLVCSTSFAVSRIDRFDLHGTALGELPVPGAGSATLSANADRTGGFLAHESYVEPRAIFKVDFRSAEMDIWWQADVPVGPNRPVIRHVTYRSRDGEKVGMVIIHADGVRRCGDNPTVLEGYGGFGISMEPTFRPEVAAWVERGGVYAFGHLRGGGERGEEWHRAGMLENKQNVFDDAIAAAEYLCDEGYTCPERLGLVGRSNGGLLVAAVGTQRPELARAVVCHVPLLDMLRYHRFLMARYWIPEYGSSEDEQQFAWLWRYSPYHRVAADIAYPAMLLTSAENDCRVHPLHARKMAAALQAATSAPASVRPILLRVERDSGHGPGTPHNKRIEQAADDLGFLWWQLGVAP